MLNGGLLGLVMCTDYVFRRAQDRLRSWIVDAWPGCSTYTRNVIHVDVDNNMWAGELRMNHDRSMIHLRVYPLDAAPILGRSCVHATKLWCTRSVYTIGFIPLGVLPRVYELLDVIEDHGPTIANFIVEDTDA